MMSAEPATNLNETSIFQTLEAYPWDNDREYQVGLQAILGQATEPSQIRELTLRAQVFYLARKKSIPIDFDAYKAYLNSKPAQEETPNLNFISGSSDLASTSAPSQASTETVPSRPHKLRTPSGSISLPRSDLSNLDNTTTPPSDPSTAPYPQTFAEIVALITSGAPIPGIKDIPPTLVPEKATTPVAKKRRKPWEKDVPEDVVQGLAEGTFGDRRDEVIIQELPE